MESNKDEAKAANGVPPAAAKMEPGSSAQQSNASPNQNQQVNENSNENAMNLAPVKKQTKTADNISQNAFSSPRILNQQDQQRVHDQSKSEPNINENKTVKQGRPQIESSARLVSNISRQSDLAGSAYPSSPAPQKTLYIYSNIFDKPNDVKKNPFEFEKYNMQPRKTDEEYGQIKMSSLLIVPKKKSELHLKPMKLDEISHDMENISVKKGACPDQPKSDNGDISNEAVSENQPQNAFNFKEKYFMLVNNRIIQFANEQDQMERATLQIKYARLKKTHLKDDKQKLWGFILMSKGQCLQFYQDDESVIKQWIQALKDTCILLDMNEDFVLGPLLGRGNFAKVHTSTRRNDDTGQKYAMKSINKQGIRKCKRNITSVLLEIDILRKLKHPFIIELYEVYESSKYIHLALQYLDGGELFERIKCRQMYQEKTAMNCMKNLLEALSYMHSNNVVHRDLKPENLILASKENDYDLRIADFGLASFIKEGELLKLRCGSPGYVAPELLNDHGYGTQADVFSAGVILHILLTGRPVFRGCHANEILLKNKKCEIEFPPKYWEKISNEAQDLVKKLLEKDPEKRVTAAEALNHSWLNQNESEMNDQKLDIAKELEANEDQYNKVDYSKLNDADEDELKLVSCTPVMAKRNLHPDVPETPFLQFSQRLDRNNATPLAKGGIHIQKSQAKAVQIGAVQIRRPQAQDNNPKNQLPQIPMFKGNKPQTAGIGGHFGGNLGKGKLQGGLPGGGLLRKLGDNTGEPKLPNMNPINQIEQDVDRKPQPQDNIEQNQSQVEEEKVEEVPYQNNIIGINDDFPVKEIDQQFSPEFSQQNKVPVSKQSKKPLLAMKEFTLMQSLPQGAGSECGAQSIAQSRDSAEFREFPVSNLNKKLDDMKKFNFTLVPDSQQSPNDQEISNAASPVQEVKIDAPKEQVQIPILNMPFGEPKAKNNLNNAGDSEEASSQTPKFIKNIQQQKENWEQDQQPSKQNLKSKRSPKPQSQFANQQKNDNESMSDASSRNQELNGPKPSSSAAKSKEVRVPAANSNISKTLKDKDDEIMIKDKQEVDKQYFSNDQKVNWKLNSPGHPSQPSSQYEEEKNNSAGGNQKILIKNNTNLNDLMNPINSSFAQSLIRDKNNNQISLDSKFVGSLVINKDQSIENHPNSSSAKENMDMLLEKNRQNSDQDKAEWQKQNLSNKSKNSHPDQAEDKKASNQDEVPQQVIQPLPKVNEEVKQASNSNIEHGNGGANKKPQSSNQPSANASSQPSAQPSNEEQKEPPQSENLDSGQPQQPKPITKQPQKEETKKIDFEGRMKNAKQNYKLQQDQSNFQQLLEQIKSIEADPTKNPRALEDQEAKVNLVNDLINGVQEQNRCVSNYHSALRKYHKSKINVLQKKEYDFEISDDEHNREESKHPSENAEVERNILHKRPERSASQISANQQELLQSNEQSYQPFVPGDAENIKSRKILNFEKAGYGMKLNISQEIQRNKNKFYQDKAAYRNKLPPPVRIFLDANGQIKQGQEYQLYKGNQQLGNLNQLNGNQQDGAYHSSLIPPEEPPVSSSKIDASANINNNQKHGQQYVQNQSPMQNGQQFMMMPQQKNFIQQQDHNINLNSYMQNRGAQHIQRNPFIGQADVGGKGGSLFREDRDCYSPQDQQIQQELIQHAQSVDPLYYVHNAPPLGEVNSYKQYYQHASEQIGDGQNMQINRMPNQMEEQKLQGKNMLSDQQMAGNMPNNMAAGQQMWEQYNVKNMRLDQEQMNQMNPNQMAQMQQYVQQQQRQMNNNGSQVNQINQQYAQNMNIIDPEQEMQQLHMQQQNQMLQQKSLQQQQNQIQQSNQGQNMSGLMHNQQQQQMLNLIQQQQMQQNRNIYNANYSDI